MTTSRNRSPSLPYSLRIKNLRLEMARRRLDGYLIQNRMDQYWLTGFTGEDGAVLVTPRAIVLLTDGRFDEAASREAPYARKVLRKKRTPEVTFREIRRWRIRRLGFNPDHTTVSEHEAFRKLAGTMRLVPAPGLLAPLRAVKDVGEVQAIRKAIAVAEQAYQALRRWLRPGLTERAIAARLAYEMQKRGAQGEAFPAIVAVGPNSSLPHYLPGNRPLTEHEVLLVDWGARVDWYGSDLTRVLCLGSMPARLKRVYDVVREAQARGIQAVRPGVKAEAVDRAARRVIEKAGYGKLFNHALGHGIGLAGHEAPRIGKGSDQVLEPGMVITIEPGVYLPGVGGVRLEDDVLVTETGGEQLSTLPLDLR